ncbi:MAG: DNA polymerase III subunit gamma/tau, partial [Achromobacter piechaudii]
FKVYMIDEVHMLTGHAFNAMLKTLEEPPPHVKFILATTDPQKIPVTVLSRCLQFNLKQMPADSIVGHLQAVLGHEEVAFEVPALRLIGQAAQGSMRDALSLTDQAIAYSAGNMTEDAVRGMLGTIDQRHLVRLLDALSTGDAKGVLAVADELAVRGLSYAGALADLAVLLSRVAIEQRVTGVTPAEDPLAADIARLALGLHPDAVQLFYSVAVHSRGELTLAPDEYAGFIMACLRMLALNGDAGPQTALEAPAAPARQTAEPAEAVTASAPAADAPMSAAPVAAAVAPPIATAAAPAISPAAAPASAVPVAASTPAPTAVASPAAAGAASAVSASPSSPAGNVDAAAPAPQATASATTVASTTTAAAASAEGVPPWEDLPEESTASANQADPASAESVTSAPATTVAAQSAAVSSANGSSANGSPANGSPAADSPAAETPSPQSSPASSSPAADAAAAKAAGSAALAVTPAVAAVLATAPADADGPPSWVDEEIPFEAEGGFVPDGGFTSDPDDD